MKFTFASLKLRIEFSWGIWAVYREIVLIQGAAQLEFYFLEMYSAYQEINSREEALSYWMKTIQIRSIQHIPGVYKITIN